MTKKELINAMERFRIDKSFTRVRVNANGHKGHSDVDGEFKLVGFSVQYLVRNGKMITNYIGNIARTPSSYSRFINAEYLEVCNG